LTKKKLVNANGRNVSDSCCPGEEGDDESEKDISSFDALTGRNRTTKRTGDDPGD